MPITIKIIAQIKKLHIVESTYEGYTANAYNTFATLSERNNEHF